MIADVNGRIEYNSDIIEQQLLTQGDNIGYIIPGKSRNQKFLKAVVSSDRIGKIDRNCYVIIKADAYPYKEYGTIKASIDDVSSVPININSKPSYQLRIDLDDNLITNHNVKIEYRPEMRAQVDIITKDKSILSRILEQFLYLLNHTTD